MSKKHCFNDAYQAGYNLTWEAVRPYLTKLLRKMETPRATAIAEFIQRDVVDTSTSLFKVNPHVYGSASWKYFLDAQAVALVKKLEFLPSGKNREDVAYSAFRHRERLNGHWNRKLPQIAASDTVTGRVLRNARIYLANLLGSYDHKAELRFGPGSTVDLRGRNANLIMKVGTTPTTSPGLLSHLSADVNRGNTFMSAWLAHNGDRVVVKNHSDLSCVPKDSQTKRVIAFEPTVNTVYQRCLGIQMKNRLREVFRLEYRPNVHHHLAAHGSLNGHLATIDFKEASNSLYYALVRFLFPSDWFSAMDAARCHYTRLTRPGSPDEVLELEMFSSNGNGFTFEMETLIFLSIAKGLERVHGRPVACSVFGDDVIIDTVFAKEYCEVCENIGLYVNESKTFIHGLFRESCGADFIQGRPVRPVFLKSFSDGVPGLYQFHNRLWEIEELLHIGHEVSAEFALRIPKQMRFYGTAEGDCVLRSLTPILLNITQDEKGNFHPSDRFTGQQGFYCIVETFPRVKFPNESEMMQWCLLYLGCSSEGVSRRLMFNEKPRLRRKLSVFTTATSTL